jgi:hypothetical protein
VLLFPEPSTARTSKVCDPVPMPVYCFGLVHAAKVPPSSLHSKVTPDSALVKVKLALIELLEFGGAEVNVGDGGAVRSSVTGVVALSAPLQLLWTGVTEYLHVPSGTDVSLHAVPATIAAHVPETMVCWVVPVES